TSIVANWERCKLFAEITCDRELHFESASNEAVIPSVGNGAARRWNGDEQIAIPLAEAVIPSVSEGSPVGRHEARGSCHPTGGFLAHARNDRLIRSPAEGEESGGRVDGSRGPDPSLWLGTDKQL